MPRSLRALLESAGTSYTVATFPSGAVLFRQGDNCDDAWGIEDGRVRLAVTSRDGREASFGLLGPGSLLSDDLLGGHREYRHSAVAIEPTIVLRVPGDRMMDLLHTEPAIREHVIFDLMAQHLQMEETLVHQLLDLSQERLAHALLTLAQHEERLDICPLPHVSQEIIAEMVGTTRSRVNVFMNRFKKLGFIEEYHGKLYVNRSRLSRAVQQGTGRVQ